MARECPSCHMKPCMGGKGDNSCTGGKGGGGGRGRHRKTEKGHAHNWKSQGYDRGMNQTLWRCENPGGCGEEEWRGGNSKQEPSAGNPPPVPRGCTCGPYVPFRGTWVQEIRPGCPVHTDG
jgi:hypothetical protein